jgi:hypothetical protein
VIEARTESVSDPGNLDRSLFDPSTLTSVGAGPLETPPWNFRSRESNAPGASLALQVVVVHAMVSPDGLVNDAEIISSSDAALNQQALQRTANWRSWQGVSGAQPGATPQSHEMFFTFEFVVGAS